MKLEKSKTIINLATAFANECMEGARYQFLGTIAYEEKFSYIQTIVKSIAKNEMAHAKVFYDHILDNCPDINTININHQYPFLKGTMLNMLQRSEGTEQEVAETLYPEFEAVAKEEGFTDIAKSFNLIAQVEARHKNMFKTLSDCIENGDLYKEDKPTMWICSNCGHTAKIKEAWERCPLCGVNQGFVQINLQQK